MISKMNYSYDMNDSSLLEAKKIISVMYFDVAKIIYIFWEIILIN